jgi:hypothetical protein
LPNVDVYSPITYPAVEVDFFLAVVRRRSTLALPEEWRRVITGGVVKDTCDAVKCGPGVAREN